MSGKVELRALDKWATASMVVMMLSKAGTLCLLVDKLMVGQGETMVSSVSCGFPSFIKTYSKLYYLLCLT